MAQQWRISVKGKQRQEVDIDLLIQAVIALGHQLRAEQQGPAVSSDAAIEAADQRRPAGRRQRVTVAIIIAVLGMTILGLVLAARWWHMDDWRRSLVAYRLYPPVGLTPDDTAAWLAGISATTHPTRYAVLPLPPVAVETVATPAAIEHYALVRKHDQQRLLSSLRATLPGVRIEAVPDYLRTCAPPFGWRLS